MIRGKTRHQLFLPTELSNRLAAMAKSQKRARSDLLVEMVDAYLNRRSAPQDEERISIKLDRIARAVEKGNSECVVISHSLYRFIRHQPKPRGARWREAPALTARRSLARLPSCPNDRPCLHAHAA